MMHAIAWTIIAFAARGCNGELLRPALPVHLPSMRGPHAYTPIYTGIYGCVLPPAVSAVAPFGPGALGWR
ncbi:hypothetical protein FHX06_001336 [Rhizobium sp. BK512]|nr:hypothetical protein [Rhizobium sp. BK512]